MYEKQHVMSRNNEKFEHFAAKPYRINLLTTGDCRQDIPISALCFLFIMMPVLWIYGAEESVSHLQGDDQSVNRYTQKLQRSGTSQLTHLKRSQTFDFKV